MTILTRDSSVLKDFDVLDERAEACGRQWALRTLERFRQYGVMPPPIWDGKPGDAMRIVDSFAGHVGIFDRQRLEDVVQEAAAAEWYDQIRMETTFEPMAAE